MNIEPQNYHLPQTIVGLDPGSKTIGVDRMCLRTQTIVCRSIPWADDPRTMTDRIVAAIGIERPALVVVEHQFQHGFNIVSVAQAAGALAWWARTTWPGVPLAWQLPKEARKLTGCGQTKADVLPWVLAGGHAGLVIDHPGEDPKKHGDAHDAAVLAAAGAVLARHNGWIH